MWTTHETGKCCREGKHVPSKCNKKAHEAQWNKRNNSSDGNTTSSNTSTSNSDIKFNLDPRLQKSLCTISDGDDFDAAAFLTTYGIDDEQPKND